MSEPAQYLLEEKISGEAAGGAARTSELMSERTVDLLLKHCPESQRGRWIGLAQRALAGPRQRQAAIRLHCVQCTSYQAGEVARCELTHCPLWDLRKG